MPNPEIEEFARLLVQRVRDAAIQNRDGQLLQKRSRSPFAIQWRAAGGTVEAAKIAIPEIVDTVVFYLLVAIDDGGLPLKFTTTGGREVDLTSEGESELAGWYVGSDGWCEQYSEERVIKDAADLAKP